MPRRSTTGQPRAEPIGANYKRLLGAHVVSNLGDGIGLVAYPWLASALTRNPLLIIGVLIAQRLPWLIFSLPFGVLIDRGNRRNLMVGADVGRAVLTAVVAVIVLSGQDGLLSPAELETVSGAAALPTRAAAFVLLIAATFLLGMGEVLHDTSAATLLPEIVERDRLEKANGYLASSEQACNQFIGPVIGAVLLSSSFALPFALDAVSFAASAVVVATMAGVRRPAATTGEAGLDAVAAEGAFDRFRRELGDGYRTLRTLPYLTLLAVVATVVNLAGGMIFAILILFAQEVLNTSPTEYTSLTIGAAAGSFLGGLVAAKGAKRFGSGAVLKATGATMGLALIGLGLSSSWPPASAALALYGFSLVVWMVLTVSLRQAITPNHLLGRVSGVYRFFSFGAIPIGAALGGVLVVVVESMGDRTQALRLPFLVAGAIQLVLLAAIFSRLSTERLEAARDAQRRAAEESPVSPERRD